MIKCSYWIARYCRSTLFRDRSSKSEKRILIALPVTKPNPPLPPYCCSSHVPPARVPEGKGKLKTNFFLRFLLRQLVSTVSSKSGPIPISHTLLFGSFNSLASSSLARFSDAPPESPPKPPYLSLSSPIFLSLSLPSIPLSSINHFIGSSRVVKDLFSFHSLFNLRGRCFSSILHAIILVFVSIGVTFVSLSF